MSEQREESRIRRILIALNATERGGLGRTAAVRLATKLHVALHGLFIEDVDLLRASALPFAKEISLSGGTQRPLTFASMEQSLQAIGGQLRDELAELAREANIAWSFDVRRESLPRALIEAVESEVLVVIGPRDAALNLARASRSKPPSWKAGGPLIVLFDGKASSKRAVGAAIQIRRAVGGRIVVQVLADEPNKTGKLVAQATTLASSADTGPQAEVTGAKTIRDVLEITHRERASLVLVGADNALLSEHSLRLLIERIECPIGVVS